MIRRPWKVIDLFSGAGGMSFGFHAHKNFQLTAAFDAQKGKPSSGFGKLECNTTYYDNIGIKPYDTDLNSISIENFKKKITKNIDVFIACPPCTGFSRANPTNHLVDDPRNSLVTKSALLALSLKPSVILMENARELLQGNFKHHYKQFAKLLTDNGYNVTCSVHFLNKFGLPQIRERALIIAGKKNLKLKTIEDLWDGYTVNPFSTSVSNAFSVLEKSKSFSCNIAPKFSSKIVKDRISSIPKDGGSWIDLARQPNKKYLLTEGMKKLFDKGKIGSFPDTYGRMAWNKPAPTIKRECSHVGNGRYAHPEKNRLCTVREMAILQGFPISYKFSGNSLSNKYRHIGDAVPPLISYQLAHLVDWILSTKKPAIDDIILKNTSLKSSDIESVEKNYGQAV
ncbi:DNA cytosine methyltransferase [Desulfobacula phenolica]|uniref:Cytosine-specific methyltransferase n=1 Tax=Desulfobacula phenolica TaxID=90732 RepID=A0A1H2HJZ8_9BACT|nr:DNA cytosine methyltransferase [Desulfobacula phenolica]SDU31888.1 DNA (cytosine-5)-methyltransferase 1 [Desulfobacula phenolica]